MTVTGPTAGSGHPGTPRPGVPRVKTAVPRLPPRHVQRPRLIAALEAAPPASIGWMSLDADDNDDHRFWSAVLTALASCPAVPQDSPVHRLVVPGRPSRDPTFLAAVLDAVDLAPGQIRLVLDDIHELT